jgi:hypothetical protein
MQTITDCHTAVQTPWQQPLTDPSPKRGEWKKNHARRYSNPLDCTRGTALGNPYSIPIYGRDGALKRYRRWLYERIQDRHPGVMARMRLITPHHTLMCTCRETERCHCDVIIAAWRYMVQKGMIQRTWSTAPQPAPAPLHPNAPGVDRNGVLKETIRLEYSAAHGFIPVEPDDVIPYPVPVRYNTPVTPPAETTAPAPVKARRPASKPRRTRAEKELAWLQAALSKATVLPDKAHWSFTHAI